MDRKSVLYQGLMNSINTPENVYDPFFSNLSLMDLLNNLDCMIAWKNVHSVFMGGNRLAAKMAGFKNTDELINISDYELKSKVSEYADEFIAQDRFVIETGQSLDILGVHTYEDDITRIILS